MTIRKSLRATNGHRAVIIVAEDDEAIVGRDHAEVQPRKVEVRDVSWPVADSRSPDSRSQRRGS